MIYINKNIEPTSIEAADALHNWRDTHVFKYEEGSTYKRKKAEAQSETDFSTWFEEYKSKDLKGVDIDNKTFIDICESLDSKAAWRLISDYGDKGTLRKMIQEALLKEQNGICCYCLQHIEDVIIKKIIEHFLAKSKPKDGTNNMATCENTYNYQNLLLSCSGNDVKGEDGEGGKYRVQKTDKSWEDVKDAINDLRQNKDSLIDVASLKEMNPLWQNNPVPPNGTNLFYRIPAKHCDKYKNNNREVIINPTQLPDCWTRFQYLENGRIEGKDEQATLTITVLNLDAYILRENRRTKWREFDRILTKQYAAEDWASLKAELDEEGKLKPYPFCAVRRALLLKKIEEAQLLEESTALGGG